MQSFCINGFDWTIISVQFFAVQILADVPTFENPHGGFSAQPDF